MNEQGTTTAGVVEGRYPDGHYRISDGEETWIGYVHHGVLGDDTVEWMIEQGYEFTPVVVLTPAEHDALTGTIATQAARITELEEQLRNQFSLNY